MLSIRNLSKKYNGSTEYVLQDINLDISSGQFVVILGLSGAGKSTLIRCMNRLIEPTSGEILWQGDSILRFNTKEVRRYRHNIGMVFQNFNLIDRATVLTNVLVGRFGYIHPIHAMLGHFAKEDLEIAKEVLNRVKMDSFLHVKARDLSGGQRQRVAIARALAQNPKLILGDEPVSSLDPATSESVMELMKGICQEKGISMVINLHSVELAKRFADRVIGISDGRIIFDNSPKELTPEILAKIYKMKYESPIETTESSLKI